MKKAVSQAESATVTFHAELNRAQFHDIYLAADDEFQKAKTEPQLQSFLATEHRQLGLFQSSSSHVYTVSWITNGTFVTLKYESTFANGSAQEEFIWLITADAIKLRKYSVSNMKLSSSGVASTGPDAVTHAAVRFVPILASRPHLEYLRRYYHDQLALDVDVLPELEPDRSAWDETRRQWVAEELVEQVRRHARGTDDAIVIGILGDDMYLQSEDWQFAFGWRADNRAAVVSYARMNPHSGRSRGFGSPAGLRRNL